MIEKYLKPILAWLSDQPARVIIFILTLAAYGGLIYMKIENPWYIGGITVSGIWAQWVNLKRKVGDS